jgi:hypothetical protein
MFMQVKPFPVPRSPLLGAGYRELVWRLNSSCLTWRHEMGYGEWGTGNCPAYGRVGTISAVK